MLVGWSVISVSTFVGFINFDFDFKKEYGCIVPGGRFLCEKIDKNSSLNEHCDQSITKYTHILYAHTCTKCIACVIIPNDIHIQISRQASHP